MSQFESDEGTAVIARSLCPPPPDGEDPEKLRELLHTQIVDARVNAFLMGIASGGLRSPQREDFDRLLHDLHREVDRLSAVLPPEMTAPAKARLEHIIRIWRAGKQSLE